MHCIFKALADPTRREILALLSEGDLAAGEIAAHFNMSWPSISHHLSILKQAELIACIREGQNVIYSINTTVFQEIMSWMMTLMDRGEVRHEEKL